jgi:hypothetical protein
VCVAVLAGCGGAGANGVPAVSSRRLRGQLESYMQQIEPIRLAVNPLLEGADPILGAFHDHRISATEAARRMGGLERRFANFTVDVAAIKPSTQALAGLHAAYARTYVFEDSYLSALVSGLARDDLADLPNTQSAQRAAIIRWRTRLAVLAREAGVTLPADLQQAGRGEIAPSPGES